MYAHPARVFSVVKKKKKNAHLARTAHTRAHIHVHVASSGGNKHIEFIALSAALAKKYFRLTHRIARVARVPF